MKRLPTANGPSTLPVINQRRLMRDLNAIGRIGIGNRGGVTRNVRMPHHLEIGRGEPARFHAVEKLTRVLSRIRAAHRERAPLGAQ